VGVPHSPSPQPVPEHDRPVPVLGGHVESLSGFWTPAGEEGGREGRREGGREDRSEDVS
jgi:hypothetical protein